MRGQLHYFNTCNTGLNHTGSDVQPRSAAIHHDVTAANQNARFREDSPLRAIGRNGGEFKTTQETVNTVFSL